MCAVSFLFLFSHKAFHLSAFYLKLLSGLKSLHFNWVLVLVLWTHLNHIHSYEKQNKKWNLHYKEDVKTKKIKKIQLHWNHRETDVPFSIREYLRWNRKRATTKHIIYIVDIHYVWSHQFSNFFFHFTLVFLFLFISSLNDFTVHSGNKS